MVLYFFNVHDSTLLRDEVGSECVGHDNICEEAMLMLPALEKDEIPKDGDRQAFTVVVRNETNVTVHTAPLTFAGLWLGEDFPPADESPE